MDTDWNFEMHFNKPYKLKMGNYFIHCDVLSLDNLKSAANIEIAFLITAELLLTETSNRNGHGLAP